MPTSGGSSALYVLTGDRDQAEELAQHAFCRVWERWEQVGGLDDPRGYLFRTASTPTTAPPAGRSCRPPGPRRAGPHLTGALARPADLAADRDHVARALTRLTPRQREALVLTQLLDRGTSHAARIMRIRPATVRVLVSQARSVLIRPPGRMRGPEGDR